MVFDRNYILYVLPEESTATLDVYDSNVFIKLLEGETTFQNKSLDIGQIYNLSEQRKAQLQSEQRSVFAIHGNHEIRDAFTIKFRDKPYLRLFQVLYYNGDYQFAIEKGVRLHIFFDKIEDGDYTRNKDYVSVIAIEGKPQIFGSILPLNEEYFLLPNSSIMVSGSAFTLHVEGTDRIAYVSASPLMDETCWSGMEGAHTYLQGLRKTHSKTRSTGPIVLVIGPRKVGKTSFCHFLVNKAVEDGSYPLYIDLDVSDNTNSLPGTLTMVSVEGQRHITNGFPGNTEILHFGSPRPLDNIRLYFLLVKEMGMLFRERVKSCINRSAGAVIDMCGSLATDIEAIRCVLDSFEMGYVYIMSDEKCYQYLSRCIRERASSSLPINFILQKEIYDRKTDCTTDLMTRISRIKQYFFGLVKNPRQLFPITMRFCEIVILSADYKSKFQDVIYLECDSTKALSMSFVEYKPDIIFNVLAVSEARGVSMKIFLKRIKYFVIILDLNLHSNTITLGSPRAEDLHGSILLMGKGLS